ncbi:MAG TPA: hypothetical protein VMS86_03340 [Thermoanaerobaculia bacterium]|nr:hypothetical protein [Thermoanaerobaculia bacterium]
MPRIFVICERDVGLFSLIEQVVANVPRALALGYRPVVYFGRNCCYWVPEGYRGRDNVWEYYFEPLVEGLDGSSLPAHAVERLQTLLFPLEDTRSVGLELDCDTYLSNHFGDEPSLWGLALRIPCASFDPGRRVRGKAARIIRRFVRPRSYLMENAERFHRGELEGAPVIGVHIRGTDIVARFRGGVVELPRYRAAIASELARRPEARILVATDDERSLSFVRDAFGDRVVSYATVLHRSGDATGAGPTGARLPRYIADDPRAAALNGEEAVTEYLLLRRSDVLVHNGASLARTVLLAEPEMPHRNVRAPKAKNLLDLVRKRDLRGKYYEWIVHGPVDLDRLGI